MSARLTRALGACLQASTSLAALVLLALRLIPLALASEESTRKHHAGKRGNESTTAKQADPRVLASQPETRSTNQSSPSRVGTAPVLALSPMCSLPVPAAALAYQTTRAPCLSSRPETSHSNTARPDARLNKCQLTYNCHAHSPGSGSTKPSDTHADPNASLQAAPTRRDLRGSCHAVSCLPGARFKPRSTYANSSKGGVPTTTRKAQRATNTPRRYKLKTTPSGRNTRRPCAPPRPQSFRVRRESSAAGGDRTWHFACHLSPHKSIFDQNQTPARVR